ncbi:MAG: hypothetical protein DRO04_01015, partial [Candidatus Iainarchaeum archaeon]
MQEGIYFLVNIDKKTVNNESKIILQLRDEKGGKIELVDQKFRPYFFAVFKEEPNEEILKEIRKDINAVEITKTDFEEGYAYKIYFMNTSDLTFGRREITKNGLVKEIREYDIPFSRRYAIDKNMELFCWYRIKSENNSIIEIEKVGEEYKKLKIGCFDIETFSIGKFSDASKDEIISIGFAFGDEKIIFTTKDSEFKYAVKCRDEKEMLEKFLEAVEKADLDVIATYNGDGFDFPYVIERAKMLGVKTKFLERIKFRRVGEENAAHIEGVQHLDVFRMLLMLRKLGVVNIVKFDLESVVGTLLGKEKIKLHSEKINEVWKNGNIAELLQYNLEDVIYT